MGIFEKLKSKLHQEIIIVDTQPGFIYAPIEGEVISLSEINDGIFSEGILGDGCGIKPAEGKVYAPFDAQVVQIASTKHAIGLLSKDGIELLVHVGMDTVKMNGSGFSPLVKTGDEVKCGQLIMNFSISEIEQAGYPTTAAIVITNTHNFKAVETLKKQQVQKLEKIIQVS